MNSPQENSDPSIEAEAALWAAKLDGSAISDAELATFDAWLAKDPARQEVITQYLQMSGMLDERLPALVAAGTLAMPEPPKRAFRWNRRSFGIAALGAAALAVLAFLVVFPTNRIQTAATPAGQRDSLTLSDGSRVELNAGTSVSIETTRTERHVRLGDGEAYFVVTKDKTRPFIVDTSAGSVRVTGTIFDVRTEPGGEMDVTVVEGNVQVQLISSGDPAHPSIAALRAGDSLSVRAGALASLTWLSSAALSDALAWRQGMVVFNGVPLRELAERYARYNGRKITVSPSAANLKIGGRSSLDDPPAFYAAIGASFPDVRITTGPDGVTRIGPGSEP
jgi:transmembrane sensor